MTAQAAYRRWQCATCGDIYDEALGLPDFDIAPGTRFDELPEDWVCPLCGSKKSNYAVLAD